MLAPMRCTPMIGLVIVMALAACKERRDDAPPPPPTAAAIPGMPAADHPWTPEELTRAAALLDELCATAPDRLPALGDPVFVRAIDPANRGTFAAGDLTAKQAGARVHNAAVLRIYATYERCGRPAEALAANAALLEGYAVSLGIGQQLIDSMDPAQTEAVAKVWAGLEQMARGLRGGVGSTVGVLTDPQIAPPPLDVATRLGAALAAVRAALPEGTLDDSLARLAAATAAETDPARRAALDAIAAALRPRL